jgi:TusA-related sulfurtransferase
MSDDVQVAKVLDLKGLACPMPVVKVSKGIKEVEVGEVIEAQTTDPGALTDFPIDRFPRLGQNQRQRNREDRARRQANYVLYQTVGLVRKAQGA